MVCFPFLPLLMTLSLMTLNCQGLRNPAKQRQVYNIFDTYKIDIAFLQETHIDNGDAARLFLLESGMKGFWSWGTNTHAGVGFFIHKRLHKHISKIHKDHEGR